MLAAIASAALIVGGSLAVGQAVLTLCGRREWTWLARAGRVRAAALASRRSSPGSAVEAAAIAIVLGRLVASPACVGLLVRSAAAASRGGSGRGVAGRLCSPPRLARGVVRLDPVHRRGRRRHPRRRPGQRRHGLAPAARRLDRRALQARAGADRPGLSARPARARRRARDGLARELDRRLRRADARDPGAHGAGRVSALDGLRPRAASRWPRRWSRCPTSPPPTSPRRRSRSRSWRSSARLRAVAGAGARAGATAIPLGVIARGSRLRLLLPGPRLAGWGRGGVGRDRASVQRRTARNAPYASEKRGSSAKAVAIGVGAGVLALVVLIAPDVDRLRDFADFRALHPDRANEGGLGNLPGQLSPLEALGIWPTSEFRLSAAPRACRPRSSTSAAPSRSPASPSRCRAGSASTVRRFPRRSPPPRSSTCSPAASAPSTPPPRRSRSPRR